MKTKWKQQILVALFLVGLPLAMAYINGKEVYESLVWEGSSANLSGNIFHAGLSTGPKASTELHFGVYDPEHQFDDYTNLDFEMIYFSWINFDSDNLIKTLGKVSQKGRIPFLVCEPWAKPGAPADYLADVSRGGYDSSLNSIRTVLIRYGGQVYFSWGHEMDQDLTKRYSWSGQDPEVFIKAYRHVAACLKIGTKDKIKWVWSPVAKKGCLRYWPGNEFADFIGFPVYSFPEWDRSYYGFIRDFKTTFNEKYELVRPLNKPVFIVEFGVTGTEDFTAFWTQQAFSTFEQFPLLQGVFFFYAKDIPKAWGDNISTPDWRMNKELVKGLIDYYRK